MEIVKIEEFLSYFEKVRVRTRRIIDHIPPDRINWTHRPGRFTFADIIRHLAATERFMFAENARLRPSRYPGHGKELADGHSEVLAFIDRCHAESMAIFRELSEEDLQAKCLTPAGAPLAVWKWLRAMIEHEIHHRGQIYLMLGMLDIATPPLYGLTSEEVRAKSE